MKDSKQGKPYTVYSDNPKMNTAAYQEPEVIMVDIPGFAMGGFVSPELDTVKDRLVGRAERESMVDQMERSRKRRGQ
jgi:hypothetical protein